MRVLEKTIEIDATPGEVWAVLTDFDDYERLEPVRDVDQRTGGRRAHGWRAWCSRRRAGGRSP